MNKHLKRSAIITSCLLLLFVTVLCGLTWRQMRQQHLDHALIAAIEGWDAKAVHAALKAGADPNAWEFPDNEGKSQTARAFWQFLRDHFTDHPEVHGVPALWLALFPSLENAIPADSTITGDGSQPRVQLEIARALLDAGANPNVIAEYGSTPLINAAYSTDAATVQLLLDHHADVNAQDSMKHTALIDAAANTNASIARVLLEHGAKIEARTAEGYTPLFVAAVDGNEDTVRLLLRFHANIHTISDEGMSILAAAKKSRNSNVVHLLEQAGAKP